MDKKPRINLHRFQSDKMKGKYLIKFGIYIVILVGLWIWYQNQLNNKEMDKKPSVQSTKATEEIKLDGYELEP